MQCVHSFYLSIVRRGRTITEMKGTLQSPYRYRRYVKLDDGPSVPSTQHTESEMRFRAKTQRPTRSVYESPIAIADRQRSGRLRGNSA